MLLEVVLRKVMIVHGDYRGISLLNTEQPCKANRLPGTKFIDVVSRKVCFVNILAKYYPAEDHLEPIYIACFFWW